MPLGCLAQNGEAALRVALRVTRVLFFSFGPDQELEPTSAATLLDAEPDRAVLDAHKCRAVGGGSKPTFNPEMGC